MTRVELVAISSSEDEGNLRFVYELLSWVEEIQVRCMMGRKEGHRVMGLVVFRQSAELGQLLPLCNMLHKLGSVELG